MVYIRSKSYILYEIQNTQGGEIMGFEKGADYYEKITEEISERNRKEREGTHSFVQIRSARLRQFQDKDNHIGHNIAMIDLNHDKVFDIPYCNDCSTVLMKPESG